SGQSHSPCSLRRELSLRARCRSSTRVLSPRGNNPRCSRTLCPAGPDKTAPQNRAGPHKRPSSRAYWQSLPAPGGRRPREHLRSWDRTYTLGRHGGLMLGWLSPIVTYARVFPKSAAGLNKYTCRRNPVVGLTRTVFFQIFLE